MSFKKLTGLAFDKKTNCIGKVLGIDYIKNIVTIDSEDGIVFANLSDVEYLEQLGERDDCPVYNHDVFITNDQRFYMVSKEYNGLTLSSLDEELNSTGILFPMNNLDEIPDYMSLIGNINEIEVEEDFEDDDEFFYEDEFDFNIKIVKDTSDGTCFYACNNKEEEVIDLIKVVFADNRIFEDDYERITISYEEFLYALDDNELEEVSPYALMEYMVGRMQEETEKDEDDSEHGFNEDEEFYIFIKENFDNNKK